jgi:hypothetical protein
MVWVNQTFARRGLSDGECKWGRSTGSTGVKVMEIEEVGFLTFSIKA